MTPEHQSQVDAIDSKREAISNEIARLSNQFAAHPAHVVGGVPLRAVKAQFDAAIRPLKDQESLLTHRRNEISRDDLRSRTEQQAQQRAADGAVSAQAKAKKASTDALEDQSAQAFGLGKGKGINYLTQNGAFYDPKRNAIAIPTGKIEKAAKAEKDKGDPSEVKRVDSELNGFLHNMAEAAGEKPPRRVDPSSLFRYSEKPLYTEDEEGNRVYDVGGKKIKIDAAKAQEWQDNYQSSVPKDAPEKAPVPEAKVDYVPVETYNRAHAYLNQLKGTNALNPVDAWRRSNVVNNRAEPAINAALAAIAEGNPARTDSYLEPGNAAIPGAALPVQVQQPTVPSIDQTGLAADSAVPVSINPSAGYMSLSMGRNDPAWAMYQAKKAQESEAEKSAKLRAIAETFATGGLSGSLKEGAAQHKRLSAITQDPKELEQLIKDENADRNAREKYGKLGTDPAAYFAAKALPIMSGYNDYRKKIIDLTSTPGILENVALPQAQKGLAALVSNYPNATAGFLNTFNPDLPDTRKMYLDARRRGEIGADVTPEAYAASLAEATPDNLPLP